MQCGTANRKQRGEILPVLGTDPEHLFSGLLDLVPLVRGTDPEFRILLSSNKNKKKTLDSFCFGLLYDFLSLKNDVNVPSKSIKQKNFIRHRHGFADPDP
jgi:hypothetical protein